MSAPNFEGGLRLHAARVLRVMGAWLALSSVAGQGVGCGGSADDRTRVAKAVESKSDGSMSAVRTRIVSLHDVTTELLVELGAEQQLVGIEAPVDVTPEVTARLSTVPRVSGLETILAARPQLVLGLAVSAERDPELVARLKEAGVEVHLGAQHVLDDVDRLTRFVAARVGATERGEAILTRMRAALPSERQPHAEATRVFVYDCCDPPFTAGGRAVLSDLIARAGGRNVFAGLATDWAHVSWEDVVAQRPALIVVHAYRYEGQADVAEKLRALARIPGLAGTKTTVLPLGCSLGGLRSAEGVARLHAALGGRT